MGLFDVKFGKLKIPLYDIGTIALGFYQGYSEGKGMMATSSDHFWRLYAPTAIAMTVTPAMIKLGSKIVGHVSKNIRRGDFDVTINGVKKKYNTLSEKEKIQGGLEAEKVQQGLSKLESELEHPKYIRRTLKAGGITALETAIGYYAGKIYSQTH